MGSDRLNETTLDYEVRWGNTSLPIPVDGSLITLVRR